MTRKKNTSLQNPKYELRAMAERWYMPTLHSYFLTLKWARRLQSRAQTRIYLVHHRQSDALVAALEIWLANEGSPSFSSHAYIGRSTCVNLPKVSRKERATYHRGPLLPAAYPPSKSDIQRVNIGRPKQTSMSPKLIEQQKNTSSVSPRPRLSERGFKIISTRRYPAPVSKTFGNPRHWNLSGAGTIAILSVRRTYFTFRRVGKCVHVSRVNSDGPSANPMLGVGPLRKDSRSRC